MYWRAPHIIHLLYFIVFSRLSVPEIPLNQQCDPGDVCEDENSSCRNFVCLCNDNHFEKYGVCCTYQIARFLGSMCSGLDNDSVCHD